jgi:hypothetical protein
MIRNSLRWLCAFGCALWTSAAAASASPPPPDATQQIAGAQRAISTHGYSAARLLMLGRIQLEHGQLGPAIASFEQGLLLAPRATALRDALSQARERAGLPAAEYRSPLSRLAHVLSIREWAFGAFASALLASLALVGWSLLPTRRGWWIGTLAFALCSGACTLSGVMLTRADLQRAYVLQDGSAVRQSPFAAATALTNLHAGESVEQLEPHAGYVYVETEQGIHGWMARDALAPLAAPSI